MGLIPLVVCLIFAGIGVVQLIKRRSLFKVDPDIIILGVYYVVVILAYLIFEMISINYRPILINGVMEASYPSSTTLLVLCVMPTLIEQIQRRLSSIAMKRIVTILAIAFGIHGYQQIDFRSTLGYGYCGRRIVKCRIIYCL